MFNPKAFLLFVTIAALLALAVEARQGAVTVWLAIGCLLYTSPSPRD